MTTIKEYKIANQQINSRQGKTLTHNAITRAQDFLDDNRLLLLFPIESFEEIAAGETSKSQMIQEGLRRCQSDEDWQRQLDLMKSYASGDWLSIPMGKWRMTDYEYDSQKKVGTVIIESETEKNVQSRLKVPMNIEFYPVPVLHLLGFDRDGTGNLRFFGDVWVKNCQVDLKKFVFNNPNESVATYITFPEPKLPELGFGTVSGIPEQQQNIIINNPPSDIVFPREGDVPSNAYTDSETGEEVLVFTYVIKSLNITNNSRKIILRNELNGKRVKIIFYLVKSARGSIVNQCSNGGIPCKPADFFLFAYGADGGLTLGEFDESNPQICLRINSYLNGVIVAPGYQVGLNRSPGLAQFDGFIIADTWDTSGSCGSNSGTIKLQSTLEWSDFPGDWEYQLIPPMIAGNRNWQPLPVSGSERTSELSDYEEYDELTNYLRKFKSEQPPTYELLPSNASSFHFQYRNIMKEEEEEEEEEETNK
ncbi:hypothetical protein [Gloeothece citriformis]|uniref:hypothetical protein n=1 Tax=Gloeothece citriformis TaxID=2546356 RepID=UPI001EF064FA|nr:hypothetical protein [Gloeothece citriformis]